MILWSVKSLPRNALNGVKGGLDDVCTAYLCDSIFRLLNSKQHFSPGKSSITLFAFERKLWFLITKALFSLYGLALTGNPLKSPLSLINIWPKL
jgi:hypothetical protein